MKYILQKSFLFLTPILFLVFFLLAPNFTNPVSANHGATLNDVTQDFQECVSGSVRTSFSWTPIPDVPSFFAIKDQQWLDISQDPGMSSFIGANVFGRSSYTTTSALGENIGHLEPGKQHYWRINTHIAGEPSTTWHTSTIRPFATISCSGTTIGSCTYTFGPSTSGAGDTIITTVSTGTANNVFLAAIVTTTGTEVTSASNRGAFPLNIALTAPGVGTYSLVVRDDTSSTLCSGPTNLTVSATGGTYTATLNTAGCTGSLSCIIATSPTLSTTNHTFTGLTGGTTYDVYVCSPNCGSGTALGNFNPKSCIAEADGSLYVDWLTNVCDGDLPPVGGGGGTIECTSFIDCVNTPGSEPTNFQGSAGTFIGSLVSEFLPLAIVFGGFLAVIMIVISGIQFITSSGNPDNAAAARGRLTFSIIGFILLVLAYALTKLIAQVFLRSNAGFSLLPFPDAFAFTLVDPSLFPPAANPDVGSLVTIIVQALISIAGLLSMVFIIIGGFKMVTSSGDPKAIASARSTIMYAIIGLIVAILSFVIVQIVQTFLGTTVNIGSNTGNGGSGGTGGTGGQAATCSVSTPSVARGGQITITAANFGPGPLPVRMHGDGGINRTDLAVLNRDPFSVTVTINSAQVLGNYRVYVDAGGFGLVYCNPDPISVTAAQTVGTTRLTSSPSGSTMIFSWGAIPNWPSGALYNIGIYPSSAVGCPPASSGNILSPPPSFTNSAGGTYTLSAVPIGMYKAALYTFAPAPISNCPIFRNNGTSMTTCDMADVNNDGRVTSDDVLLVSSIFLSRLGDANFNPDYDMNKDNVINSLDQTIVGQFVNQTC